MGFSKSDGSFMVKFLRNVVLVLLLIVFISIVYNFRNKESDTVSALMASALSSQEYKGVFIRDEEIQLYSGNGVLSYNVSDGGKVGNDTVIAEAYLFFPEFLRERQICPFEALLVGSRKRLYQYDNDGKIPCLRTSHRPFTQCNGRKYPPDQG